ncbi:MAG TPA: type II toxin-antitoxin system VapC family toxin [Fimbriimonas sp.]|nr:type II toxin-antitoxin system VapC family toxin [Fimbriimonas sp.]
MTVLDTNVILYHLAGKLAEPLPAANLFISVISEIELLSYPGLSPEEEAAIQRLVWGVQVLGVTEDIKTEAITLRKLHRLKLADSIIAATAITLRANFLTHDSALLRVPRLKATAPELG